VNYSVTFRRDGPVPHYIAEEWIASEDRWLVTMMRPSEPGDVEWGPEDGEVTQDLWDSPEHPYGPPVIVGTVVTSRWRRRGRIISGAEVVEVLRRETAWAAR
jgi:hypothetical protein